MNHNAATTQFHEIVARRMAQAVESVDLCVKRRPEYCLAGAVLLGVFLGWWIKRR
jgi:hypothetical protein